MRVDLAAEQFCAMERGQFTAPDGAVFVRRSTKVKRRVCDEAIAQGSPLVLYYWAGHQLDWLDGDDAQHEWTAVRVQVTAEPRRRGDLEWTAGFWDADDERSVVVLMGHC
jgi:hypothetical protein